MHADLAAYDAVGVGQLALEVAQGEEQRREADPHDQRELPAVDEHDTVAISIWPTLMTKNRPPKTRNWLTWSTSLVTRETSTPRRSVFWVSSGRSWTCRKALIRSVARPRSEVGEQPLRHEVGRATGHRDRGGGDQAHERREGDVGPGGAVEAAVEGLLDDDRDHDLADGGHQRQQQGAAQMPSLSSGLTSMPRLIVSIAAMPSPLSMAVPTPSCSSTASTSSTVRALMGGPLGVLVGVDQAGVRRAAGEQLLVGAAVSDPAVLEVHDLVGERDGGLAVGDDDQRRVVVRVAERGQDPLLDLGVHRRRGVVEDQQPRPARQRAGQRDPLPLPARERGAPLPELGVQPARERGDEAVGLGRPQCGPHLVVGDVGAEGDVAADVVVEEERGLRHQRDRGRQLALARARAGRPRRPGSGPGPGRPAGSAGR